MSEHVPGPSHSGSVVLNVGPGIGALVLHVPADLDRREIEISSHASPAARAPTRKSANAGPRPRPVRGRLPRPGRR